MPDVCLFPSTRKEACPIHQDLLVRPDHKAHDSVVEAWSSLHPLPILVASCLDVSVVFHGLVLGFVLSDLQAKSPAHLVVEWGPI